MKTIENILNKYKIVSVLLAFLTLIVFNSCEEDDDIGFADERYLPGELAFFFNNPNPDTGEAYTEEEKLEKRGRLGTFAYNPDEEERYLPEQSVILNWMLIKQISELTVSNVTDVSNVSEIFTFASAESAGDMYSIRINTTLAELGITEEGQEINTQWEFTYTDGSVGKDFFTIAWAKPPPEPPAESDLPFLIGPKSYAVKGMWEFNDPGDLAKPTLGVPLELVGSGIASAEGVDAIDGAVAVQPGSALQVFHGLPAVGGSLVNDYTLIYDVRLPDVGFGWTNLLQTNVNNDGDGSIFINSDGDIWAQGSGTSDPAFSGQTWYRVVVTLEAGTLNVYVDGTSIYNDSVGVDNSVYALDLSYFYAFFDNNNEDGPIECSSLILLDEALSGSEVSSLPNVSQPAYKNVKDDLAGRWKFDDTDDLGKASIGVALELVGAGTSATAGVDAEDGAVAVQPGSALQVFHGLPAVGGSLVNDYTLIYDVRLPDVGFGWTNLLQTNVNNDGDGSIFINSDGDIWAQGSGTSDPVFSGQTWYRVVVTLEAGTLNVYVDGTSIYNDSVGVDNSVYALDLSYFYAFFDNNNEDGPIECSDLILLSSALSSSDVGNLPSVDVRL